MGLMRDALIDRKAVVSRHNVVYTGETGEAACIASPLSVGNGAFCVTVDYTGLQTFAPDCAAASFPLCTMAEWAWHRSPAAPPPAPRRPACIYFFFYFY